MKIYHLVSSLQNGLTTRSSPYRIWFQMRCLMTSCLNHDYLILIFIHFPYLPNENISLIIVSAEPEYFSTISSYRNINLLRDWKGESVDSPGPVACFSDKYDVSRNQNNCYWPLRNESIARGKHHMQEKLVYCRTCLENLWF